MFKSFWSLFFCNHERTNLVTKYAYAYAFWGSVVLLGYASAEKYSEVSRATFNEKLSPGVFIVRCSVLCWSHYVCYDITLFGFHFRRLFRLTSAQTWLKDLVCSHLRDMWQVRRQVSYVAFMLLSSGTQPEMLFSISHWSWRYARSHVSIPKRGTRTVELDYVKILNRVLPPEICVLSWAPVDPSFSAR